MAYIKKWGHLSDEEVLARYYLLVSLIVDAQSLEKVVFIQQRINVEAELKKRSIVYEKAT